MQLKSGMQQCKASIERVETNDQEKLRSGKTKAFRWQARIATICLLARALLLYHYVKYNVEAQQQGFVTVLDPANLIAWAFIIIEVALTLYRIIPQYLEPMKFGPKARFRPQLRISGDEVPTIDVLIFYCGEDLNVLLDTVRAACSVDYPQAKFRVVVLDDSDSVSEQIQALEVHYPNLLYSTRGTGDGTWHKAGNINHGLSYVASLPEGPNELVAGLDVDMLPEKDWLRRLAPHLIQDAKVGIVSPNQRFYNVPHGDPLAQLLQLDQFQNVRQLRSDFSNAGIGVSTGWLARRSALDSIGGFAVDGIEDVMTCMELAAAGWTIAIVDENVQWGMVPDSLNGHMKQYHRWATAMLSCCKTLPKSIGPRKQLGFQIVVELNVLSYIFGIALCYLGVPLMVFSGQPLIRFTHQDQLKALIRLSFVDFIAQSINGFLESWAADFNIYCWHELGHLWDIPVFMPMFLHHWSPIPWNLPAIQPADTANSVANKSSEDQHTSPWKRLHALFSETHTATHLYVLFSCIAGFVAFLLNIRTHLEDDQREIFQRIITHAGWPPIFFFWTSALKNSLQPFYYALFVPPRPKRENHLARDPKTHVAYPTAEAKDQRHRRVREWHLGLIIAYFAFVVAASWWL